MKQPRNLAILAILAAASAGLHATGISASLEPARGQCTIGASRHAGKFRVRLINDECKDDRCGSTFDNDSVSRLTGITTADFEHEGARLTAALQAEAGTFTCAGAVHDGSLQGDANFTPDAGFIARMAELGVTGLSSEKLETYAFLNVESAWLRSLQQTGLQGITADKLIALRIFNVDEPYIHAMTQLGYELPDADKLIAMRVQGVDPAQVKEIRALGLKPTLDELIQMRIFQVTPEFIRRMQARDLKDLTIARLVQIRIFKLAD
jgi:hypothetical protein